MAQTLEYSALAVKAVSEDEDETVEDGGIDEEVVLSVSDDSSGGSCVFMVTEAWLVTVCAVCSDGRAMRGEAQSGGAPTSWSES